MDGLGCDHFFAHGRTREDEHQPDKRRLGKITNAGKCIEEKVYTKERI